MSVLVTDFNKITNRSYPNTLTNDKWIFTFSNIPTLPNMSEMRYFDSYVKSFLIPDYNLDMINIDTPLGFMVRHPVGGVKANTGLSQIQVEFKVSEDMLNYLTIMKWIHNIRYGEITPTYSNLLRLYCCDVGTLSVLDNQKRPVVNMKFTKMLPSTLGSLQLVTGAADEVTFNVNFTYEEIEYDLKDPMIGGTNPSAPELISPCSAVAQPVNVSASWNE